MQYLCTVFFMVFRFRRLSLGEETLRCETGCSSLKFAHFRMFPRRIRQKRNAQNRESAYFQRFSAFLRDPAGTVTFLRCVSWHCAKMCAASAGIVVYPYSCGVPQNRISVIIRNHSGKNSANSVPKVRFFVPKPRFHTIIRYFRISALQIYPRIAHDCTV